jgi:hypothetical protein
MMPRLGRAAVRNPPMPYRLLKLAEALRNQKTLEYRSPLLLLARRLQGGAHQQDLRWTSSLFGFVVWLIEVEIT